MVTELLSLDPCIKVTVGSHAFLYAVVACSNCNGTKTHELVAESKSIDMLDKMPKGELVRPKGQVAADPRNVGLRRSSRERAANTRWKDFVPLD